MSLRNGGILAGLVLLCRPAAAQSEPARPPIPEPLLAETVTDIDGTEAGEIELEANGSAQRARSGGASAIDGSLELEWLATRRLGLRLEPTIGRDAVASSVRLEPGISGGLSWKLLQDFERDLHLQAEVLSRAPWDESIVAQPGDPAAPFAFDVRGAVRRGPWSFRPSLGVGAFGSSGRAGLRASLAVLLPFEDSGRFGFWGVEVDADGGRSTPVLAALDLVPNLTPAGLPLRIGLALPVTVGAGAQEPSVGIYLRLFYESDREIAFAAHASPAETRPDACSEDVPCAPPSRPPP